MDEAETETVTDAEAKAALLALGGLLDWQRVDERGSVEAMVSGGRYRVRLTKGIYWVDYQCEPRPIGTGHSLRDWSNMRSTLEEAKELCEWHYDDHYVGFSRVVCLMCGEEIQTDARWDRTIWFIKARREGQPAESGFVHRACSDSKVISFVEEPDLTGKPDYSDYNEDRTLPLFEYDPVEQGRRVDEELRQQAAQIAVQGV